MAEILGGNGLHKAFKALGIKATRTYRSGDKPHYEVWEVSKDDVKKMDYEVEWQDEWGWFRYTKGSNMGTPFDFFTINGKELIAWDGYKREDLILEWAEVPFEERTKYNHSIREYENKKYPRVYEKLTDYMAQELGASTEKNVCALAVDLARANGMTMAQLFKTYEG